MSKEIEKKVLDLYDLPKTGFQSLNKILALSNPSLLDSDNLDDIGEHTFLLRNQMKTLRKPIACGVSILGISKAYIISMWYRLSDKLGYGRIQLIFTDTDSLISD